MDLSAFYSFNFSGKEMDVQNWGKAGISVRLEQGAINSLLVGAAIHQMEIILFSLGDPRRKMRKRFVRLKI